MLSHLKFAIRSLRKTPGFMVVSVLVLALGIGVNIAIFSLFHQLVLRPLPVSGPDRLVNLSAPGLKIGSVSSGLAGGPEDVFSYPMFRDLAREQKVFTGIAAHQLFRVNIAYRGQVKNGAGVLVSGSYFPVLGAKATLGRLLGPMDDAQTGATRAVVLSYDYWRSRFAANPAVLNDTLIVNGQPLTIVGVAPRGFEGTAAGLKAQVFAPLALKSALDPRSFERQGGFDNRLAYWVNLFARLKPGVSLEQARTQINVPYRAILNDVEAKLQPIPNPKGLEQFRAREVRLGPGAHGRSEIRDRMNTPFLLLLGVTFMVLLIACANVANLLLARGAARSGEMALRLSLGATRGQVVAQLLTESGLLAVCGGLAGVACAYGTLHLATLLLPQEFADAVSVSIDSAALGFALALACGAALLSGLLPALRSARTDLLSTMKGQSGHTPGGGRPARLRMTLIAAQTVLAMLLLVSAGLLIKSLANVGRVDLGINADSLVTFRISPELNGYSPTRSRLLFERLERDLSVLPGVRGVTASFIPILADNNSGTSVSVQGFNPAPGQNTNASYNQIGAGYFRTLGIALIAGREFEDSDASGAPAVAIVNERFARQFNLGADAVGQWMSPNGGESNVRIVGIVQDAKYSSVKDEMPPQFFLPYRQDDTLGSMSFYVRAATPPEQTLSLVAKMLARLDPNLPLEAPKTLAQQIGDNVFLDRFIGALCAAFAMLATLLAAVGLYGMLSYAIAQRTKEIGVRMALGAQRRAVAWPIVRNALWLSGVGVALGGLIALALARIIRGILFGVEPDDPMAIAGAAALLLVVAGIAAWLPAWRASKVDPLVALRAE